MTLPRGVGGGHGVNAAVFALSDGPCRLDEVWGGLDNRDVDGGGEAFLLPGVDVAGGIPVVCGFYVYALGRYGVVAFGTGDGAAGLPVAAAGGNGGVAFEAACGAAGMGQVGMFGIIGGFAAAEGKAQAARAHETRFLLSRYSLPA